MVTVIAAGVSLLILLVKTALALVYARRCPPPAAASRAAEVTVLQAILSGDPGLEQALEDNLKELGGARLLWLVDEDDAEARSIVERLRARHPEARARTLLFPPAPEGISPKLFKLEGAWREAETPVVLVLDDDTRLPRRSLDALVEGLESAELSTGLPYYRRGRNFSARLLAQFVNDNAPLTYLPMLAFRKPVSINGMAYALRRETLERIGGFEPILRHLTDDLAVARHVLKHGGHIRQTPFPQEVETSIRDFPHYWRQMHRWFMFAVLLMRTQPPAMQAVIFLQQAVHPLLLWTALLGAAMAPSRPAFLALSVLLWARWSVLAALQKRFTGRFRMAPALSLLAELLQPLHLVHAALSRTMRWRSRVYRVWDNDRFAPL